MPKNREIIGEFGGELRAFENATGRVVIGNVTTPNGDGWDADSITVKGEADKGQLHAGLTYRFFGQFREHHKYGRQFWFSSFALQEPAGERGIINYLKACPGIGLATAATLWELYGPAAVEKLRTNPDAVAENTPRFSPEKARAASNYLNTFATTERTKIDLIELIDGRGFPRKTIDRCIKAWGTSAANVIRDNPYVLMKFPGIGFVSADKFYLDIGGDPASLERQALCAWYEIASNGDGSTWYPLGMAHSAVRRAVAGVACDPKAAVDLAVAKGMLTLNQRGNQAWVAITGHANAERSVADSVCDALSDPPAEWPTDGEAFAGLRPHQQEQVAKALGGPGRIGILAGGPGTGKTYASAIVIREIVARFGENSVAVAAPTGKAAVRITEAMREHGVTIPATTIHRLLIVETNEDGGWSFAHGPSFPLAERFIFIDEPSMLDTTLLARLLAARGADTHILFAGDINQLPPVGHGAPLRDMIAAGVPCGELTEIHRNSGRIVRACAEIRDRQRFDPSPELDIEAGENLKLHETGDAERQIEIVTDLLTADTGEWDRVWDYQVLVPVNAKSALARRPLNLKLQDLLNRDGERVNGNPFRVGDKVINLQNGWLPEADAGDPHPDANEDGKLFVANGEQAEVLVVEPARTIVRLWSPERIVVIPHGHIGDDVPENDEDEVKGIAGNWDLAYAISGHKSQGSQWPHVIVVLDGNSRASRVMSRQWLFTAISRAKVACHLIGERRTAMEACRRDALTPRKTFLTEAIREQRAAAVAAAARLSEDEIETLFAGMV